MDKTTEALALGNQLLLNDNCLVASNIATDSGNTVQTELDTINQNLDGLTTYSSESQIVGKLSDGKTVYREYFSGTTPTSNYGIICSLSQIPEKILSVSGSCVNDNGNHVMFGSYMGSSFYSGVYLQKDTSEIRIQATSQFLGKAFVAIIEYIA